MWELFKKRVRMLLVLFLTQLTSTLPVQGNPTQVRSLPGEVELSRGQAWPLAAGPHAGTAYGPCLGLARRFVRLSAAGKAEVRRLQLGRFLAAEAGLSQDQRTLVLHAISLISSPGFCGDGRSADQARHLLILEGKTKELFPDPSVRALFYRAPLAGAPPAGTGTDMAGATARAQTLEDCDCYSNYYDCGGGDINCKRPANCQEYPSGCGYLGGQPCTGICVARAAPPVGED